MSAAPLTVYLPPDLMKQYETGEVDADLIFKVVENAIRRTQGDKVRNVLAGHQLEPPMPGYIGILWAEGHGPSFIERFRVVFEPEA